MVHFIFYQYFVSMGVTYIYRGDVASNSSNFSVITLVVNLYLYNNLVFMY